MAQRNNSSGVEGCLREVLRSAERTESTGMEASQASHRGSSSSRGGSVTQEHTAGSPVPPSLNKLPACHMELEVLAPSASHTVLIDVPNLKREIVPKKGTFIWDAQHVKLPHHGSSHRQASHWNVICKELHNLSAGRPTVRDVESIIKSYNPYYRKVWSFDALGGYVKRLPRQEDNFSVLIPRIAKLALQLPTLIKTAIPLLRQGCNGSITLSQGQIACLLANAFFCTFPHRNSTQPDSEYSNFSTINFSSLFGHYSEQNTQKLRAILHYFNTVTTEGRKQDGLVTFERCCIPERELPNWREQSQTKFTKLRCSSHGSIEDDGKGMLQVDFANKFIGGAVLGSGLVQEEILFLMNPELIVARLFTEKLSDNECLKITGAQRYSSYSGYSSSFQWTGPYDDKTSRDEWRRLHRQIVAIDAIPLKSRKEQFTPHSIKRELNKAYCGFKDDNIPHEYLPAIATGNWGCGAFHGDPRLKALIQMMAAAVAKRDVAYFTFGDEKLATELLRMHQTLTKCNVTVGALYKLLCKACDKPPQEDLFRFIEQHSYNPRGLL